MEEEVEEVEAAEAKMVAVGAAVAEAGAEAAGVKAEGDLHHQFQLVKEEITSSVTAVGRQGTSRRNAATQTRSRRS